MPDISLVEVTTMLTGQILPPPKEKTASILVEGEKSEAVPDQYGRFEILVHRKSAGDRVLISVWVNKKQVYDDYQVLPGPVKLTIRR